MATPQELFRCTSRAGKGNFGDVYKGVDLKTQEAVAIKIIDLETAEDEIEDIEQEIRTLAQCDNEHVTRYYGSYLDGSRLWIVMEYLEGGALSEILEMGTLTEEQAAVVLKGMLGGLSYLHSQEKLHRDIKAANILVSKDGQVKLADFGVSAQMSEEGAPRSTFVGTPYWMAPEVILQQDHDAAVDVWSLGITAVELVTGRAPLSDVPAMNALLQIPQNEPPTLPDTFGENLVDFVGCCLKKNPRERSSAWTLLQHNLIQSAGGTDLLAALVRDFQHWSASRPQRLPSSVPPHINTPHKLHQSGSNADGYWEWQDTSPPPSIELSTQLSRPAPTTPAAARPQSRTASVALLLHATLPALTQVVEDDDQQQQLRVALDSLADVLDQAERKRPGSALRAAAGVVESWASHPNPMLRAIVPTGSATRTPTGPSKEHANGAAATAPSTPDPDRNIKSPRMKSAAGYLLSRWNKIASSPSR